MATRHLFVTDLDGTLLRSDAALSAYALAGLSRLLAEGLLFTVASARALPSIQTILRGLPLTLPVIELNGTLLSDFATGEHLKVHAIDASTSEGVLELLTKLGLSPFVATAADGQVRLSYGALANTAMHWYRDEKLEKADPRLRQVERLATSLQDKTLAFTLLDRHERLVEVVAAVESSCGGRVKQHLFEHPYCVGFSELSIHDAGATKASAIAVLQQMLGAVGPDALTVFGDNVNDIDMFRIAGRSVAPSNAVADVLSIATHVAASNDEDGVVTWLQGLTDASV